ncbi:pyridoxal phosphate-dependent aminotransferase [Myroides marinus]|uniref:Aminotransferase n=1 Tax=Myroides marinus TaxID=703342 RepID=A0A165QFP8_9FLAO|nr:pyridoxal phosphate-dependent aminotransferase [Myroides marinus]KUF42948.1 aspartate aminotransferase [Myroides marinus]KZE74794.1 aspartate aminotransferase [Myroides marinus]MDM1346632.1 pyridoxal phosphate-dependent aminotransferase [Myroides marinus]MDM1350037.1 pyridoxal phosphate-dependent aminotransferase [Myroides marinus]MDM1353544.1 pyridoxal phosphate-dependent aminotransferase [Myroides marinus]
MPKISNKGLQMPESPIRKLVPFAEVAKQKGHHVYHLNIGQPDIKTPAGALQAVKDANFEVLEYSHSAGIESYRKKLAKHYQDQNLNVDVADIIVTTGGSEALLFALGSTMDQGDEIIIPEPFYANYNGFSTSNGVNIVPVMSSIDNGFALPAISEFEKLITPKTKAILICNPGNPTGYLYSEEEMMQLTELVVKHDLFIIADEVYREFAYDGYKHISVMSIPALANHAIMIDSVSKRYSMCGARIGCIVSKNKDLMAAAMKFAQARLSPPTFEQIAAEAALDTPKSYFDEVITEYKERRDVFITALQQIEGVQVTMPHGSFYCVAKFPIKNADNFAKWLLEEYDLNGETVMIAPAAGFYSTPGVGLNEARMAYVLKKEDLIRSAEILKQALKVYQTIEK